jgi:hypothetical protein
VHREEEEMWQLKSHRIWLNSSDRNTTLFHRQSKARIMKNNAKEITLKYGSNFFVTNRFENRR